MAKRKPCNLTKTEWNFLANVFSQHIEDCDGSLKTQKILDSIYNKVFFMDYIIKEKEND